MVTRVHQFSHFLAHFRGIAHHMDPVLLQTGNLVSGRALATRDDRTSVTHAAARRSSLPRNERHNRQVACVVLAQPLRSFFFSFAANLANHDNSFGFGVVNELRQDVDEVGSVERIATNADYS